ncbi:MAG: Leucine Rich repeats (2 copies) [Firmicutes bacterium ADurb.BinA205]|nr:MAG: Leucine Rich repeats (2 copies) [Firmicutes bacterium ADurb.BinA205]
MKFKNLVKKSAAASVSLCMLGSAMSFNAIIPDVCSVVAHAADAEKTEEKSYSFNEETGELTFKGNIDLLEIIQDSSLDLEKVNSIAAEKGTVFTGTTRPMLYEYKNCEKIDLRNADFSQLTSLNNFFSNCKSLQSVDLSGCDLDTITNMRNMFNKCENLTSVNLTGVKSSNVTTMERMFSGCSKLKSVDLSSLANDKVVNMSGMFEMCSELESIDISSFSFENLEDISMFCSGCTNLRSVDMSGAKKFEVKSLGYTFTKCENLTEIKLGEGIKELSYDFGLNNGEGWINVNAPETLLGSVSSFAVFENKGTNTYMRCDTYADIYKPDTPCFSFNKETGELVLKGQVYRSDLINFGSKDKVKKITAEEGTVFPVSCSDMFRDYKNCETMDLSNVDTSKVNSMDAMFILCGNLTTLDLSGWDTSKVTDMSFMFNDCSKLETLDLSSFDTGSLVNMCYMFSGCYALSSLDLSSFNTSKVNTMNTAFCLCKSLKSLDLSHFDTSNVTNMSSLFKGCSSLESVDLSGWNTEKARFMDYMFAYCNSLKNLDLSSFKTKSDTDIMEIFANCTVLESVDMSGMSLTVNEEEIHLHEDEIIGDTINIFNNCSALKEIKVGSAAVEISDYFALPNASGWVNVKDKTKVISGNGIYAVFKNEGANTYIRLDSDEKTDTLYGDANCDGIVDLSDAVIIMQAQSNPAKFGENGSDPTHMTAQGIINGDVSGNGDGITSKDALTIQKYLLGLLLELPE